MLTLPCMLLLSPCDVAPLAPSTRAPAATAAAAVMAASHTHAAGSSSSSSCSSSCADGTEGMRVTSRPTATTTSMPTSTTTTTNTTPTPRVAAIDAIAKTVCACAGAAAALWTRRKLALLRLLGLERAPRAVDDEVGASEDVSEEDAPRPRELVAVQGPSTVITTAADDCTTVASNDAVDSTMEASTPTPTHTPTPTPTLAPSPSTPSGVRAPTDRDAANAFTVVDMVLGVLRAKAFDLEATVNYLLIRWVPLYVLYEVSSGRDPSSRWALGRRLELLKFRASVA